MILIAKLTIRVGLTRKCIRIVVLTGKLILLHVFFSVSKPSFGVISLKVRSNACGLVKLEKAYNLTLSLVAVKIVSDLVEI